MRTIKLQGDLTFVPVSSVPKAAKKVQPVIHKGREVYILQLGEATGHAHVIETSPTSSVWDVKGQIYTKVGGKDKVTHEQHQDTDLEKGVWKVVVQQEFDYEERVRRQVSD